MQGLWIFGNNFTCYDSYLNSFWLCVSCFTADNLTLYPVDFRVLQAAQSFGFFLWQVLFLLCRSSLISILQIKIFRVLILKRQKLFLFSLYFRSHNYLQNAIFDRPMSPHTWLRFVLYCCLPRVEIWVSPAALRDWCGRWSIGYCGDFGFLGWYDGSDYICSIWRVILQLDLDIASQKSLENRGVDVFFGFFGSRWLRD